jgi:hypothetical protein
MEYIISCKFEDGGEFQHEQCVSRLFQQEEDKNIVHQSEERLFNLGPKKIRFSLRQDPNPVGHMGLSFWL